MRLASLHASRFAQPATNRSKFQKTNNAILSGLLISTFSPSFIHLVQNLRQLSHEKLRITVHPCTGPVRYNEKENLLASLGG